MKMYIGKGRCNNCLKNKKVIKFGSPTEFRGLCRLCLKKLSEDKDLK